MESTSLHDGGSTELRDGGENSNKGWRDYRTIMLKEIKHLIFEGVN